MPTGEAAAQQQQQGLRIGDVVERDIDGVWFPAKVLAVHERRHGAKTADRCISGGRRTQLAYDLVYLDDHNRESEVPEDEVRAVSDYETEKGKDLHPTHDGGIAAVEGGLQLMGDAGGILEDFKAEEEQDEGGAGSSLQREAERNHKRIDEDDGHTDREDCEGPKVTIHSSHGTFDTKEDGSATAYIINGPETNVAAGSGLRGIRWLRGP